MKLLNQFFQFTLITIIGITLLTSCKKEEALSGVKLCDSEHFYYSPEGSKVFFKQSLSEIGIVFEQDEVTKELAASILNKYSFIDFNVETNYYKQIKVRVKENVDCTHINNYLMELNKDNEIFSATPVFYTSENNPNSSFMLLSEVLTKNREDIISESDFINYAETLNLELIEADYGTQYFKVKDIKTGFESLDISNQIFESGKVEYAEPNIVIEISHN